MNQSLIEYIKNLIRQGYDEGTIRNTLLNAGYSPYDIDLAMRAARVPKRIITTKTLVFIFIAVVVVSIIVLVVIKLSAPKPVELDLSLVPLTTTISPGQAFIVTAKITNPSGSSTKAIVEFSISGPDGLVTEQTATATVREKASLPSTIILPATIRPGFYTLKTVLSWNKKHVEKTVNFEVTEKPITEAPLPAEALEKEAEARAREVQRLCPGGCDDYNACTEDVCIEGTCKHIAITPCCGNGVCESGETKITCSVDCAPREKTPGELVIQAKTLAQTNPAQASAVCNSIGLRDVADECFSEVATITKNKQLCESIVDSSIRDGCYITFAYENDFTVCEKIENRYTKNSCNTLKNMYKYSEMAETQS